MYERVSLWSREKGTKLTRHEQLNRFNRARVAIKHHGTLPAHMHVEEFRGIVGDFLKEYKSRRQSVPLNRLCARFFTLVPYCKLNL